MARSIAQYRRKPRIRDGRCECTRGARGARAPGAPSSVRLPADTRGERVAVGTGAREARGTRRRAPGDDKNRLGRGAKVGVIERPPLAGLISL